MLLGSAPGRPDRTGHSRDVHHRDGGVLRGNRRAFLESSQPGLFVAGDIRAGSTKRVASAVGEGAMAVTLVHRYLANLTSQPTH
jgi:thioredoxin reductase